MNLRKLLIRDKAQAVRLHLGNLSDITSMAGEKYVDLLYEKLLDEGGFLNYGIFEGSKLYGIVTAVFSYREGEKALSGIMGKREIFPVAKKILTGRMKISRVIKRMLFIKSVLNKLPFEAGGIIILCVDKKQRRLGIGRMLINRVINDMAQQRVNKVCVDTLAVNKRAISFYEDLGFKTVIEKYGGILLEKYI